MLIKALQRSVRVQGESSRGAQLGRKVFGLSQGLGL